MGWSLVPSGTNATPRFVERDAEFGPIGGTSVQLSESATPVQRAKFPDLPPLRLRGGRCSGLPRQPVDSSPAQGSDLAQVRSGQERTLRAPPIDRTMLLAL